MRHPQRPQTKTCSPSTKIYSLLVDPQTYNDGSDRVEVEETHLSWVFLSRTLAVKLKKPLRFDFVDLTTAQSRYCACQAEMRVNRRWSDGVYLGVVPITIAIDGDCQLGGISNEIDWIVEMRRLPAELQVSQLLLSKATELEGQFKTLAEHLVGAFISLPAVPVSADAFVEHIRAHEDGNLRDLLRLARPEEEHRFLRIHNALLQYLWLAGDLFESRVNGGCVVDGHGDLRPEHVYLETPIQIIDSLEFSDDLRTNDQLDELCFFAMECEKIGAHALAKEVLDCYRLRSHAPISAPLVEFYKAYRAVVRTKVMALRAEQLLERDRRPFLRQMRGYLDLADSYAQRLGRPWMIVLSGLMGSGKSTLSDALSARSGAEVLSTDAIRREMLGKSAKRAAYGESNYDHQGKRRVYARLVNQAADALDWGRSVVLDGTFLTESQRRQAITCARRCQAPILFVRCQAPRDVLLHRLTERYVEGTSASEARPDLLDAQAKDEETFGPSVSIADVDTTTPIDCQVDSVRQHLRQVCHLG